VRAVAIGAHGEVFCGGFAEFGFWQTGADGRMTYHSLSAQVRSDRLDKEEIWHILAGKDFVLFQSFSTIYKYDYHQVTILQPPNSIMFAREVQGRVLVPVIERGIYELLADNTFRFLPGTEILADKIIQFLVPDGAGSIWAGTTNHGIFQLSNGQCRPWNHPLNAVFKQVQLNKAIALREGGWVIGTILNGAYVLDPSGNLRYHLNRENGLQNNTVLALCEDRDGNLWLGLDRGIDHVSLRSALTFFSDQTGKIGTLYTAARWKGLLYVGTNQGVFARNGAGFQLIPGTQGQVWQLQVLNDQLFCGHNSGTFLIDKFSARKISDITGGWCTVVAPGKPGVLVQSTYTGLAVFRSASGGAWELSHRVEGFKEPLKKIVFDTSGNLWGVHPNKGLFRLRLNDQLTQVGEYQTFTRGEGLPTDFQLDIARIGNDLILDAHGPPLRISGSMNRVVFEPVSPRRQKWLPGREKEYFAIDSSGLQLLDDGKIYAVQLALVPNFEQVVDLGPREYLFCLENGFALLDRNNLTGLSPPAAPGCFLRRVETPEGNSFLPSGELIFAYRQNSLKFFFAAPVFDQAPRFSWKLDGFSTVWSPWQDSPEKEFTNLPAGKYTFRVRTNTGGPAATLAFRIGPPWYLSGWALAFYGFVLLALFGFAEKTSRNRLSRQRTRLEADKRLELARHRNDAEREKLALEVENKSRELGNAALNLIRKNEVLQRLRDELLGANGDPHALKKLARLIDQHLEGDHDWEVFEESFNRVHDDFFKRLMYQFPDLTPGDLRLAAYLKMNLSSKEIAPLLNISVRGVENKRYRLRKKLGLSEEANLTEYIMGYISFSWQ
jgi:DNA-binding CsgD family transcriptional regulator